MIITLLEIAAAGLVLLGIIYEEKLIELEGRAVNRLLDVLAVFIAKLILLYRKHNRVQLAPMPGIKAYIAPKRHSKANLVCSEFEF